MADKYTEKFIQALETHDRKAVLHEEYKDAVKLALEVYEKFKKINKDFKE